MIWLWDSTESAFDAIAVALSVLAIYLLVRIHRPMRLSVFATAFFVAGAGLRGVFSAIDLLLLRFPVEANPGLASLARAMAAIEPAIPTLSLLCIVIGVTIVAYQTINSHATLDDRDHQFKALLEHAKPLTLLLDDDGQILEVNHGASLAGVALDDGALIGKLAWDVPYRAKGLHERLRNACASARAGSRAEFVQEIAEHDGRTQRLEIAVSPIGGNRGRARFILVTVEDKSEQHALMRKLLDANDRGQSLLTHSMDAIVCVEYGNGIDTSLPVDQQVDAMYDGVLVECNAEYVRMLGRGSDPANLTGKLMRDTLRRTASAEQYLQRFIRNGYRLTNWSSALGFQGNRNMLYSTNTIGIVEDGRLRRAWAIYRDVTEESRRMDAATQAAERHASLLQAQEAYFCYEYDPAIDTSESTARQIDQLLGGRLVECNQAYCEMVGIERPDLIIGRPVREVSTLTLSEAVVRAQLKTFVENGYAARRLRIETSLRQGREATLIVSSHGIVRGGRLVRRWGVILDVSDEAEMRRALHDSEQRFQRMAETSPALIYRITIAEPMRFDFINDAIHAISGYSRDEALRKDGVVHEVFSKKNIARLLAHVGKRMDAAEPVVTRHLHRTNGEVFLEHRINAIRSVDGDTIAIEGVALDVTERLTTETKLKQALDEISALRDELHEENVLLRGTIESVRGFDNIVGNSPALQRSLALASKAGPTDTTVLILGETGTGKELLARAIHELSGRRSSPLICVNCAALPAQLIESELFGHERGAFTGASTTRKGRFELATGGTLFLDEIGDMSLELQSKLLRVVQEGTFERLGGTETMRTDVRLIAATNKDLRRAVEAGEFRADLYYRLNVFPITMPPLRDRPEDIPLLAHYFANKHGQRLGKQIDSIAPRFLRYLAERGWPGNVRELEAVIERALIATTGNILKTPVEVDRESGQGPHLTTANADLERVADIVDKGLHEAERQHILHVLTATQWTIEGPQGAAHALGIAPSTLRSKMKKLGIKRPADLTPAPNAPLREGKFH